MTIGVTATAAQPGSRAVSAMSRRIIGWAQGVQADPEVKQVALDGINDAIDRLNVEDWHQELQGQQTIVLDSTTSDALLNTDFKKPLHLERLNASGYPDGTYFFKSFKTFMREHPVATSAGTPEIYTILYDQQRLLRFNLTPTTAHIALYPSAVLYYDRYVAQVNHEDHLLLPGDFCRFIEWHGRAYFSGYKSPDKYQTSFVESERMLRKLMLKDNNTVTDWSEY